MKADVQYNDFIGSVAADISDFIGSKFGDDLENIGKYFEIDKDRFTVIGISISGTENFHISLYCVDKIESNPNKEYIVKMSVPVSEEDQRDILDILFKRLHIVLHDRFDKKYPNLDYDREVNYEDFHEIDEDEQE